MKCGSSVRDRIRRDGSHWMEKQIPFGPQLLFVADQMEELVISAEICEDVWSPVSAKYTCSKRR